MTVFLPNLQRTFSRWNAPSTWLLLALGIGFFGPALYDSHVVKKPWITASLEIENSDVFGVVIKDRIDTTTDVVGERLMWIENTSGTRICYHAREDGWSGQDDLRIWSVDAFFQGKCSPPAKATWRVCNHFVVETDFGSHGRFGPYCSEFYEGSA